MIAGETNIGHIGQHIRQLIIASSDNESNRSNNYYTKKYTQTKINIATKIPPGTTIDIPTSTSINHKSRDVRKVIRSIDLNIPLTI